ncbi:hypothetical protein BV22DRAFT_1030161 [Leucogyrophana mollusca]|uniref:Uncharacterized protein n=1 Tax=Leucogyrophana mollusca TaxID=85980 RepID=A0ACB8BSP4_9AGAM|nr:hypothetical protein BV22DRAFT_1030161 [Leucogyrophana mollusca]
MARPNQVVSSFFSADNKKSSLGDHVNAPAVVGKNFVICAFAIQTDVENSEQAIISRRRVVPKLWRCSTSSWFYRLWSALSESLAETGAMILVPIYFVYVSCGDPFVFLLQHLPVGLMSLPSSVSEFYQWVTRPRPTHSTKTPVQRGSKRVTRRPLNGVAPSHVLSDASMVYTASGLPPQSHQGDIGFDLPTTRTVESC